MSSIKGELPNISPAVLALALQEARWDVPAAMQLVSIFLQACGSHLEDLKQVLPGSLRTYPPSNILHGLNMNYCMHVKMTCIASHSVQKHFVPRQSAVAAGHPPAAASGSDDSSPARPRHKRKGKSKKDKSKKDKKHKRRHAEKVYSPALGKSFKPLGVVGLSCAFPDCCSSQISPACLHKDSECPNSVMYGFCIHEICVHVTALPCDMAHVSMSSFFCMAQVWNALHFLSSTFYTCS